MTPPTPHCFASAFLAMLLTTVSAGCRREAPPAIRHPAPLREPALTDAATPSGNEQQSPKPAEPLTPFHIDSVDVVVAEGSWPDRIVELAVAGPYRLYWQGGPDSAGAHLTGHARWVPDPQQPDRFFIVVGDTVIPTSVGHEVFVIPKHDGTLSVGGRAYRGLAILRTVSNGRGQAVNRLPLDDYIAGVVGSEMPRFGAEALKAQAVAARSYTCYRIAETGGPLYAWHTVDQAYKGMAAERPDVLRAVSATRGEVLAWRGLWFKAFYHSTCGGRTRPAEAVFPVAPIPPLGGGPCGSCRHAPRYRAHTRLTQADMQRVLQARRIAGAEVTGVAEARGELTLALSKAGRDTSVTLPADEFRMSIGPDRLISSRIDSIAPAQGGWTVQTQGFGHGVGLCQYGADGMARDGASYRAILARYYPRARIEQIPPP